MKCRRRLAARLARGAWLAVVRATVLVLVASCVWAAGCGWTDSETTSTAASTTVTTLPDTGSTTTGSDAATTDTTGGAQGTALYPAENADGDWGFIDETGAWVVEPHYKWVASFSEDLAAVLGDQYGFIDRDGAVAIPLEFAGVGSFSEGLAPVFLARQNGNRWGYIDLTGAVVLEPRFNDAEPFSEGMAVVRVEAGLGYIDPPAIRSSSRVSTRLFVRGRARGGMARLRAAGVGRRPLHGRDGGPVATGGQVGLRRSNWGTRDRAAVR